MGAKLWRGEAHILGLHHQEGGGGRLSRAASTAPPPICRCSPCRPARLQAHIAAAGPGKDTACAGCAAETVASRGSWSVPARVLHTATRAWGCARWHLSVAVPDMVWLAVKGGA